MDFGTLVVSNWILLTSNALVLYGFAFRGRRLKGVAWFAHGLCVGSVGMALALVWGHVSPRPAFILIANAMFLGSFVLLRRGLEELAGNRMRLWPLDGLVLAAQTLLMRHFSATLFGLEQHFVVMGFSVAAETGLGILVLWRASEECGIARRPTLAVLLIYETFNVARAAAGWALLTHPKPEYVLLTASAAVQLIFSTLFSLGSVWLATAEQHGQLTEQARRDALTGVLNRRALQPALTAAIDHSRLTQLPLACLTLDLDHFKHVNDTYGHAGGDAALCAVAQILAADLRDAERVARLGGEEFVIMLPGHTLARARARAERLRQAIAAARFHFDERSIPLTASFGVALFDAELDRGPDIAEALLRRADRALYGAKHAGRNCTHVDDGAAFVSAAAHAQR